MGDELVGRRAERGVPRRRAVLRAVDVRLQVLDARPHGEGLALEREGAAAQQLEDIACGVPAGEDDARGGDALLRCGAAVARLDGDSARRPVRRAVDVDQAAAEADLAPEVADALDDPGDDGGQDVRAHVGLRVPEDLAPRPRLDQRPEDQPVSRVARAGVELAVGEGPGAPESELDVALRVECALGLEALDGPGPPPRVVAALDEQGLEARLGEGERGEQPRAPRAHHHRALEGARRRRDRGGPAGSGSSTARTLLRSRSGTRPSASGSSAGSASATRALRVRCTSRFLRASTDLRCRAIEAISGSRTRSRRLASARQASRQSSSETPASRGTAICDISIMSGPFNVKGGRRPTGGVAAGRGAGAGPPTRPPPRRPRAGRRAMPTRG